MKSLTRLALLGAFAAAPVAAQTPAPAAPAPAIDRTREIPPKLDNDSLEFARQVTLWFYSGQVDSLWAHTSPEWQSAMGSKDRWSAMFGDFIQRLGSETELVQERWIKRNGQRQYVRVLRAAEFSEEPVAIRWVILPGKRLGGAGMNPLSRMPPADPK